MSAWQELGLTLVGSTSIVLGACWLADALIRRYRHPVGPVHSTAARLRDPEVARELCECRRYLFICEDSDTPHAHEYRDGGTVHRPDLCQPAEEAL